MSVVVISYVFNSNCRPRTRRKLCMNASSLTMESLTLARMLNARPHPFIFPPFATP